MLMIAALSCLMSRVNVFVTSIPIIPDPANPTRIKGVDYDLSDEDRQIIDKVVEHMGALTLPKKVYDPLKRMLC